MTALGIAGMRARMNELGTASTPRTSSTAVNFHKLLAAKRQRESRQRDGSEVTSTREGTPEAAGWIAGERAGRFARGTSSVTIGAMLGSQPVRPSEPLTSVALPAAATEWMPAIEAAAREAGLDARLLAAITWAESRFNPGAVSRAGALGLTQLMPGTADALGVDATDPVENLKGGARFLAWTIAEFGSVDLGLAAYNAGPGAVRAAGGVPDNPETQAYVPKVLEYFRLLGGRI